MKIKILLWLSLFGILDSWYLVAVSLFNSPLYCVRGFFSCDTVLTSSYARLLFGIPNSVIGIAFYGLIFIIAAFKVSGLDFKFGQKISGWDIARWLIVAGFLVHLYFVYLQFFVLRALCLWCLVSAFLVALLFAFSWSEVKTSLGISKFVNKAG